MAEKEIKGIKKFLEEFKAFAMRGNVLDMAVGVVIGSAFTAIVNSLVNDIINPAIGLFFNADFSNVGIHIGDVTIGVGSFINAIINFLIVAFVLFMVIKTVNALHKKPAEPEAPAEPTTKVCPPTARAKSPSRQSAAPTAPPSSRASRRSTIKFQTQKVRCVFHSGLFASCTVTAPWSVLPACNRFRCYQTPRGTSRHPRPWRRC